MPVPLQGYSETGKEGLGGKRCKMIFRGARFILLSWKECWSLIIVKTLAEKGAFIVVYFFKG